MLSAQDIHSKNFSTKFRGYNVDEVNEFLSQVTKDYQVLSDDNEQLKKDLKSTQKQLEYFDDLKNSLNQSIIVAQEAADKLKQDSIKEAEQVNVEAQKQADVVLTNATDKANEIVKNSSNYAEKLAVSSDDFRDNIKVFRAKLISMLEGELDFAKSEDWDQLLSDNSYEDFEKIKKSLDDKFDKSNHDSVESSQDEVKAEIVNEPTNGEEPTVEIYPNEDLHKNN
ncbi:DivIVA domain-containing protein [Lactobacillus sp. S2-2]|uniref:DivIVA domain-containing protein n=1 Tax=Lactobacillus sp. S2-2 TaxID=2692917 RepID=UPI001F236066|nr:DivIVA domain-containing protein [Lactobacillus sp. S2-2]MCF6514862.1 DivIVA domain-containing protein [Lactobacillus sp. S2-2]